MMRMLTTSAALVLVAVSVTAQLPGAAAKAAAQKAAAATNAHIEAEQAPTKEQAPPPKAPVTAAKTQAPASKAQTPAKTGSTKTTSAKTTAQKTPATGAKKGATPAAPAPDTAGPPPTIWRESFTYSADHRRDPFNSLLTTNELRPTLSDLKITGILFDPAGRRSFATLRDLVTNAQYRVTNGSTLGRMRVAAIRTKIVVFTIDEFGTTRQDSLVFGDTTKARVK
jgi:hypothetical protein